MKQFDWKYIALFILAIPIVTQLADYLGKSTAQYINEGKEVSSLPQADNQKVRIVVASEDAEGVTQKDLDINFLKLFEAHLVGRVKLKTKEILARQGYSNAKVDISSEATYVYNGSIKLIVIRLRSSDGSNQVFITGVVGDEFKRIICVRDSKEKIPITYGVCAEKIKEVFGTKIGA